MRPYVNLKKKISLLVIPNFKGKTRVKTVVARHLTNSDKDSYIDDRRRLHRKIHQVHEIQREIHEPTGGAGQGP